MPGGGNTSLVVGVQSIIVDPDDSVDSNSYSATVDNPGFFALIDSTLPYLWLPQDVCDKLQTIFRLTYDSTTEMYLVNETSYKQNKAMNPQVTFKLGNSVKDSNDFISISLSYDAFDLQAQWPIYSNATRYFPIKRSPTGYYVLGRAFLQETYIIVDYERNNFTVAQATFSDPMPSATIVSINAPNSGSTLSSATPIPTTSSGHSLGTGAIAGISIAGVVILIIIAILVFFFRKQQLKKRQPIQVHNLPDDQNIDGSKPPPYDPTKQRRVSELDAPVNNDYASSRTSSQGYAYSELETPDLVTVEMRMKYDAGYFADATIRSRSNSEPLSPSSLDTQSNGPFELPADHGVSEVSTVSTRSTPS